MKLPVYQIYATFVTSYFPTFHSYLVSLYCRPTPLGSKHNRHGNKHGVILTMRYNFILNLRFLSRVLSSLTAIPVHEMQRWRCINSFHTQGETTHGTAASDISTIGNCSGFVFQFLHNSLLIFQLFPGLSQLKLQLAYFLLHFQTTRAALLSTGRL